MVSVPGTMPVTIPVAPIVAVAGAVELQVPPADASVKVVEVPGQFHSVPLMAAGVPGADVTVTELVVYAVPQELDTV